MKLRFTPTLAFVLASIAYAGHVLFHYSALPETVATHFDLQGNPNGFSSKAGLLALTFVTLSALSLFFFGVGKMQYMPTRFINIPHREYWLAPERRAASLVFMCEGTRWLLVLVMTLSAVLTAHVLHANLSPPPRISVAPIFETLLFFIGFAFVVRQLWRRSRCPRFQ